MFEEVEIILDLVVRDFSAGKTIAPLSEGDQIILVSIDIFSHLDEFSLYFIGLLFNMREEVFEFVDMDLASELVIDVGSDEGTNPRISFCLVSRELSDDMVILAVAS